jgi:hypothetical protein
MGGKSSTPAASSSGGYSNAGAMARATIGGTTGSNVAGMGYVPRAQAASSSFFKPTPQQMQAFGNTVMDATKGFGGALAGQSYDAGSGMSPSAFGQSQMSNPFAGLFSAPSARVSPFRIGSAAQASGVSRPTSGFRI